MVQYILTPWRHRRELLEVRRQFYPDDEGMPGAVSGDEETRLREKHRAVGRVSVWMQRGACPHLVESTALLTAAILSDAASASAAASEGGGSAGTYAARAAYAAAFSRFVTGLLDGHQDKQRKLSMYSVAKTIGLPATFVELRHQATHEQLPSLAKLRSAARKALAWIWEYYWRQLTDVAPDDKAQEVVGGAEAGAMESACRDAVLEHLEGDEHDQPDARTSLLGRWGEVAVVQALEGIADTAPSTTVMLRALRMTREVLQAQAEAPGQKDEAMKDLDDAKAEKETREEAGGQSLNDAEMGESEESRDDDGTGWSRYGTDWKPKPIGVV